MFLRDIQKKRQTICGIYVSGCDTEKSTRHLETTQGAFLVSQVPGPLGTSREVDIVTPAVSWAKQRRVISIRMRVTKHTHIQLQTDHGALWKYMGTTQVGTNSTDTRYRVPSGRGPRSCPCLLPSRPHPDLRPLQALIITPEGPWVGTRRLPLVQRPFPELSHSSQED